MIEDWGNFVNIEENDEDFSKVSLLNSKKSKNNYIQTLKPINECKDYESQEYENQGYENQKYENQCYKKNEEEDEYIDNNLNKETKTIFILVKMFVTIYSFSVYIMESFKTVASKLSFNKNN